MHPTSREPKTFSIQFARLGKKQEQLWAGFAEAEGFFKLNRLCGFARYDMGSYEVGSFRM